MPDNRCDNTVWVRAVATSRCAHALQKREVVEELLPIIAQQFKGPKVPADVWDSWFPVLLQAAPCFDRASAESCLLTPALKSAQTDMDGGLVQRLNACRLLAPAAAAFRSNEAVSSSCKPRMSAMRVQRTCHAAPRTAQHMHVHGTLSAAVQWCSSGSLQRLTTESRVRAK
jgi:hypothetical protein